MPFETDLQETPTFSVNKLAEYMVASATRRRSLIAQQIEPVAYRTGRYSEARRILTRFCADPDRTTRQLHRSAAQLRDKASDPANDEFHQECLLDSARALEAFAFVAYDARVRGLIATVGAQKGNDTSMGGVRVKINPDIFFLEPGTERRVGGVKLHFARTDPLNKEALQYVAALLFHYIKLNGNIPRARACLAIDIFSGVIEATPKATKTRIRDLTAACQEIAERWPSLRRQAIEKRANSTKG